MKNISTKILLHRDLYTFDIFRLYTVNIHKQIGLGIRVPIDAKLPEWVIL